MVVRVLYKLPDEGIDAGNIGISINPPIEMTLQIKDEDDDLVAELRFKNIAAHRFSSAGHTKDLVKESINGVVEIIDSKWPQSLNSPSAWPWVNRHFSVFLESVGYIEILAEDVKFSLPV